jgi:ABC-type branched-subunit amino acid transport system substrate-binding protein
MVRRFLAFALASLAAVFAPGIGFAQSTGPILIAVHLDQAKQASYYSLLQKDAIDLFVKELNDSGGINGHSMRVLYEDDENNPVTTATKVDKLASAGVCYIVPIGSSASLVNIGHVVDRTFRPYTDRD